MNARDDDVLAVVEIDSSSSGAFDRLVDTLMHGIRQLGQRRFVAILQVTDHVLLQETHLNISRVHLNVYAAVLDLAQHRQERTTCGRRLGPTRPPNLAVHIITAQCRVRCDPEDVALLTIDHRRMGHGGLEACPGKRISK